MPNGGASEGDPAVQDAVTSQLGHHEGAGEDHPQSSSPSARQASGDLVSCGESEDPLLSSWGSVGCISSTWRVESFSRSSCLSGALLDCVTSLFGIAVVAFLCFVFYILFLLYTFSLFLNT